MTKGRIVASDDRAAAASAVEPASRLQHSQHPLRVLVCGGRKYANDACVNRVLDGLHRTRSVECIIQGGANGADQLARVWAISRGVLLYTYDADWSTHGRRAGPIRNQLMIDEGEPGLVVAFPGGSGTADMTRRANAAGVKVIAIAGSGETVQQGSTGTASTRAQRASPTLHNPSPGTP